MIRKIMLTPESTLNENQISSLTYDEWLKLIEVDPTMREYAKSIVKKKDKNAQKDNVDTRVNS